MEWQLVAGVSTVAATVAAIISTVISIWWRHVDEKTVKWVISDIRPVMLGDAAEYYFQTRLERPDAPRVSLIQIGQADAYNPHATIDGFAVAPIKLNGKPLTRWTNSAHIHRGSPHPATYPYQRHDIAAG